MKLNNQVLLLLGFVVVLLSGCAGYKAKPLKRFKKNPLIDKKEKCIHFDYYVFNKRDCKKYLGRDVIAKGYKPIYIEISNNTDRHLDLSNKRFSLPSSPYYEVADTVYTSTTSRAVGYGVAGLFLWPFFIPAVVDSIGSSKANEKLDKDYAQKSLDDQIVGPFSTVSGIVFVPEESFDYNFTFTTVDIRTQEAFTFSPIDRKLKA